MYAFDVHCNSFFPLFLVVYVGQYVLLPFILSPGFLPALASNLLYLCGVSYYFYITFLGYTALPFLDRTVVFLGPIVIFALATVVSIVVSFNPSMWVMNHYFGHLHQHV